MTGCIKTETVVRIKKCNAGLLMKWSKTTFAFFLLGVTNNDDLFHFNNSVAGV